LGGSVAGHQVFMTNQAETEPFDNDVEDNLADNRPPGAHPKPGRESSGREQPYDEEPETPGPSADAGEDVSDWRAPDYD
jgi:hypothetical protein